MTDTPDLVARLREMTWEAFEDSPTASERACREAADQIEALREYSGEMRGHAEELQHALGQMLWPDPRLTNEQVRDFALAAYRSAFPGEG